jgi:hypothetical protein
MDAFWGKVGLRGPKIGSGHGGDDKITKIPEHHLNLHLGHQHLDSAVQLHLFLSN